MCVPVTVPVVVPEKVVRQFVVTFLKDSWSRRQNAILLSKNWCRKLVVTLLRDQWSRFPSEKNKAQELVGHVLEGLVGHGSGRRSGQSR